MSVPDKHCSLLCQRTVSGSLALSPPDSTSKRCERTEQTVLNLQSSKDVAEEDTCYGVSHYFTLCVAKAQWREVAWNTEGSYCGKLLHRRNFQAENCFCAEEILHRSCSQLTFFHKVSAF